MRLTATFLTIALICVGVSSTASADYIVRGVRCSDAAGGVFGHRAFNNHTGRDLIVTIRITRDSCRPRLPEGTLIFDIKDGLADVTSFSFLRGERRLPAESFLLSNSYEGYIRLVLTTPGTRVSGTFDYILTVD